MEMETDALNQRSCEFVFLDALRLLPLITTYDSSNRVENRQQKEELIQLLQRENQDLHNFYVQSFKPFT